MTSAKDEIESLATRRHALAFELELLDAQLERAALETICGLKDDAQDVEHYDGQLGVTRGFVDSHERPIGQLQWLSDLHQRFAGADERAGNVAGQRWGSGGLITPELFLTAGHCFDRSGGGWQRPRRGNVIISSDEIASLMRVNFDFQVDGTTGDTKPGAPFPIEELLEYKRGGLDYAIVRLGRDAQGRLPGEVYGHLTLAAQDLTTPDAMLCMIQHPSGRPKRVEAGPLLSNLGGRISYDSLDTQGGSSGSPVLAAPSGQVVGVHTNGGCSAYSGANYGLAIGAIRQVSTSLP